MRRLTTFVHAVERDDKGNTTRSQTFGPSDDVPDWAVKTITNPDVWDGEDDTPSTPERLPIPPRAGAGATADAWRAYAAQERVEVPDTAGRDEIIAAVDAHTAQT